jgi:uncharacterized protein (DUF1778 family)
MRTTKRVTAERKTERMELRMTPTVRATIERAVAVSGLTAGDLAFEAARRVIEDQERMNRMILADADRDLFVRAMLNPPEPAPRLVAAMKRLRTA